MDSLTTINTRVTDQLSSARGDQVKNNAGGHVFQVTPEDRLRRFLVLGVEGGTYYVGEAQHTRDNAGVVIDFATNNTKRLVDIVREISLAGRAPKQNPAIFALAAAAGLGNEEGRAYALASLSDVARTGTHLFLFAQYIEQFRGWGRGLRRAVGEWYEKKDAGKLAYQMAKYRQRNGWSHRDLLRLAHPAGTTAQHKALYAWATQGEASLEALPAVITDFLSAQTTSTVEGWVSLINDGNLSWEMLPDAALSQGDVWRALIDNGIPQTALMRQLPRLTRLDVLKGTYLTKVMWQLQNAERLQKARVHPVNVLLAQRTYASGRSARGSSSWSPLSKIVDALDAAFYASFKNVEPANKRTLNALDVSGSMGWNFNGGPLSARDISAAMSLVTLATEPEVETVGFTGGGYRDTPPLTRLPISARQRLDDVIRTVSGLPFGTTDCSLPMQYAISNSLEIDTFVVWTDSETYAGKIHPFQALKKYREQSGIDAKLIVCATESTGFTIADPTDAGMLDVVGFDSAVPNLIADFSAGRI